LASIHLVYVRISGKGIAMHWLLRDDDDTGEIGIGNVLGGNNRVVDLMKSWMKVDNGRGNDF
jgi:hypothetical protein